MNELEEALDALEDIVNQHCQVKFTDKKTTFDSMALSAKAYAMRVLAKHKKIKILKGLSCGRRIIATRKNT